MRAFDAVRGVRTRRNSVSGKPRPGVPVLRTPVGGLSMHARAAKNSCFSAFLTERRKEVGASFHACMRAGRCMRRISMKVLLAQPRGFCAGVTRAIAIVERALAIYGAPIYVRHEIVHNRTAACAFALDKQLKSVDLPTFGRPTIPHCKAIIYFVITLFSACKDRYSSVYLIKDSDLINSGYLFQQMSGVISPASHDCFLKGYFSSSGKELLSLIGEIIVPSLRNYCVV